MTADNGRLFSREDTNRVKGFAILLMLMHHCFLSPDRYEGQAVIFAPFSEGFINDVALAMKVCVALFVFLSGYGIMSGYTKLCGGDLDRLNGSIVSRYTAARGIKLWTNFVFVFLAAQLYAVTIVRDERLTLVYGHGLKAAVYYLIDMLGLAQFFSTPTYLATFWYISLAWIIIFIAPLFICIYRRFGGPVLGFLCLMLSMLFPVSGNQTYAYFPHYAFTMAIGMISADKNLITRMADSNGSRIPKPIRFIGYNVLVCILTIFRQLTRTLTILPLWDGFISLLICVLFFEFVGKWRGIRKALEVIGIYSANIFLLHNFIRIVFYYDFTYSFRYWWLILLVLLALSLATAAALELIKKLIHYDRLVSLMLAKADRLISAENAVRDTSQ